MPARVQRDYHVGDRVLVKGPKGDNLPKPAGRKRAQRRKYAAVITAVPDEARGRVGYRVIYDGGHPRREGRVPKNDISDIPHDYDGRAVTSPLPAGAPRLDDDAEPGSENEDDEFFDPEVEEDGDLDEDERVEGPGQRLLDDEADAEGSTRQAIVLWEAAAEQGLGAAASALGAIYDRGEGMPRNLAHAAIWYAKASELGDDIATERLEELRVETAYIFRGMKFV